ncbi:FAD-dependent monooxygenase [Saccharothrix syringae]|uniref:FAD-dependent monooxygenase n=1 Tax=Saccharothrix syringae TaxID=103733 RepID=UPI00068DF64C|nr:FAD-dependent monooxygenase [Saccharothrix syringae]
MPTGSAPPPTRGTDVLVVGAGPVGLAMALDLRYRGIDHLVVERRDGRIPQPGVSTIGPRSMELFRRWGLADDIRAAGWPPDHPLDIAWVTRVGGHELHRFERGSVATRPEFRHTPEPDQVCPAHWLQPLLVGAVGRAPDGPLLLSHRLDSFTQDDDGVTAHVTDLGTGTASVVRARYLVACDGASSPVRRWCGIDAPARHEARVLRNILFRAPELTRHLRERGHRPAMVYFLMLSNELRYPLRSMDGGELFNLTVSGPALTADPTALLRDAIAFDTPVEPVADDEWHLTHWVAERYRHGRVFLAGDAAHTVSPSGGFGMNIGIADAADLGWKLAAHLRGWGGEHLLDSYEAERRPVALDSLEAANRHLQRTLARALPVDLRADTPEGERRRAEMAERLRASGADKEFDNPEVHFGYRYRSPLVIGTGAELTPEWRPGSDPGSRAAHAWLRPGVSLLDVFGEGFVLLCFGHDPRGTREVREAFDARGVPLRVVECGDPELARLYACPFVLVRPDGHVAWRDERLPADPVRLVDAVRGSVLAAVPSG